MLSVDRREVTFLKPFNFKMIMQTTERAEPLEKIKIPILAICSDSALLDRLEKNLLNEGNPFFRALNEQTAMDLLDKEPFGVIIWDQALLEKNGLKNLFLVKKAKKEAIIIFLTTLDKLSKDLIMSVGSALLLPKESEDSIFQQVLKASLNIYIMAHDNNLLNQLIKNHQELLSLANSKLRSQLLLSSQIHKTMLVGKTPHDLEDFQISSMIIPSQEIDNDFFDFFRPLPQFFDFVIGDVMGKGLPAALVGIAVKTQINRFADLATSPLTFLRSLSVWEEDIPTLKEIIGHVHHAVVPQLIALEYFVSMIYGRFDRRKREFSFIDCGFTRPLYYRAKTNKVIPLSGTNFPLGVVLENDYYPTVIPYDEKDIFLFYSDGVTEAVSSEGDLFGEKKLIELLEKHAKETSDAIVSAIKNAVTLHIGKEIFDDDITVIIFKIEHFAHIDSSVNKPVKFNSVISQLKAVRALVRDYCHKAPGDSVILAAEMELVIDEVFSNLVKHSYKSQPGGAIFIHASYEKEGLILEVADQGESFNPSQIPHPNLFGDKDTGYGWYLIKHIADTITYLPKRGEGGWNRLKIFKRYFNKEAFMDLKYQLKDNIVVITLGTERLDALSITDFKDKILDILTSQEVEKVVLDLHQLNFIDSSGLGAFLSILRLLNTKGGQLKLAALKKPVKAIFELVSMHKIFESYETVDQAINSFSAAKAH